MESWEFNDKDLVSCIDAIINEDIGTCDRYPSGYEDEYEKDFAALANGTNNELLDEICDILIDRWDFNPVMIKHYKCWAIKMLVAFFAKIQLDIYEKSKTDHSYMGPEHIDLSLDI